ncbi:YciI family protein [Crenobacter luteus]|uniref:YCII-related domain-containing protein n=1 Tax=Crenobacter luteus TaxID=1452487 RepID=A0A165EKG8_9NEIS|nr:YciI family protein [Crenobacter luteus]KZE25268.1 hypothetical protein AVW16_02905 [Crenobacter luteus]
MLYAIIGRDRAGSLDARLAARPDHLARLTALQDEGRLILAGPCPAIDAVDPGPAGFTGSLIVAEFASLEAARAWADADPYVAAGVYEAVEVKPFRKVLPA